MRKVICRRGDITVQTGERRRSFQPGDVADLDQVLVQSPRHTLEDALGPHVANFEPYDESAAAHDGLPHDED